MPDRNESRPARIATATDLKPLQPCRSRYRRLRWKSAIFAALIAGFFSRNARPLYAEPLLKDGDRAMFVGDSFVHQHGFTAMVMDACAAHHPGAAISFRTEYVSQLVFAVEGIPQVYMPPTIDRDILSAKPTVVMISFGLQNLSTRAVDKQFIERFFTRPLASVVKQCQAAGARVILVTPGCLDASKHAALFGNAGEDNLAVYAQAVKEIAANSKVPVIDLAAHMREVQTRGKAAAATFSLYEQGIELTAAGHAVVAGEYLRALGEVGTISEAAIDVATRSAKGERCAISDLNVSPDTITFSRADEAIPAYFPKDAAAALQHDPSLADQERYMLKVEGLKGGNWKVSAAGIDLGTFTSDSLATGVNLARLAGPWHAIGERIHAQSLTQETLFEDRSAITHIGTPQEAEPQRLALLANYDAYVDVFEKARVAIPAAQRTWTWKIERVK